MSPAECLPLEINTLPDFFRKKAQNELNETSENKIERLKELKEMAKDHKLLREWDFHDDFLLQFLRHNKFNADKALKVLRNYVHFRTNNVTLFESIDFDRLIRTPSIRYFSVLPKRCPDGCTIILVDMAKWDPEELSFEDMKRINMFVQLQALRNPMSQINGYKMIYDFTNTATKLLPFLTPKNLYTLGYASVKFHSHRELLSDHIPPCCLPSEYGGQLTDYYMEEWTRKASQQQKMSTFNGQTNYFF